MKIAPSKNRIQEKENVIYIVDKSADFTKLKLSEKEVRYVKAKIKEKQEQVILNRYDHLIVIVLPDLKIQGAASLEKARISGNKIHKILTNHSIQKITVSSFNKYTGFLYAFTEGLALSNYQFLKYFADPEEKKFSLKEIFIADEMENKSIEQLNILVDAVYFTKDLINEPASFMNAEQMAHETQKIGLNAGFRVEIFNKKKIESLKFGGLLAVNKGSIDPPTFTILEWKPVHSKNTKPVVLVGKGVVYDTGGLSLKPTQNSMDLMKSDMSGAAAVIGTFYAIARAQIPVHVIGLIPATDNRPDGNAYAPGDIITMHNGSKVEVMNTDAEGRLILADALSYAKKYEPQLVIDLATLTGAASRAIGTHGIVAMGTASSKIMNQLLKSGENTYERLVIFPFWDEYKEMIKSDIADIKNLGGNTAGAITAGKFLEHFTNYPFIHLDIAGPAFITKPEGYKGKGGTGVGVRLLFDFLKNME